MESKVKPSDVKPSNMLKCTNVKKSGHWHPVSPNYLNAPNTLQLHLQIAFTSEQGHIWLEMQRWRFRDTFFVSLLINWPNSGPVSLNCHNARNTLKLIGITQLPDGLCTRSRPLEMSSRGLLIILRNHVHDLKYMDLVSPNWPNASNTLK